jgi:hypothetical protein
VDEGSPISTLREGAEIGSALGGIYHRICWDSDFADPPWIDTVQLDAAVPEWRYGRLYAVPFWRVIKESEDGKTVVRQLERHEPGAILHAVYVGEALASPRSGLTSSFSTGPRRTRPRSPPRCRCWMPLGRSVRR